MTHCTPPSQDLRFAIVEVVDTDRLAAYAGLRQRLTELATRVLAHRPGSTSPATSIALGHKQGARDRTRPVRGAKIVCASFIARLCLCRQSSLRVTCRAMA